MTRQRAFVLAAAVMASVLSTDFADAQIPAAPGSPPRDEEPGRAREVVPLPPVPEHMAVPTPTEGVDLLATPEPSPEPSPPFKPKPHKHHKSVTPKPADGVEKL